MKRDVKILFSPEELTRMKDADFLLAKRIITEKLYELLQQYAEVLKANPAHRAFSFPEGTDFQTGKISKGENLKGLPYVILDLPRLFDNENVFAFRTMFWWGNYFSCTLHLKGKPLKHYRDSLIRNFSKITNSALLLYTGEAEWEHDLNDEKYVPAEKQLLSILKEKNFIKLGKKLDIADYQMLNATGLETYKLFLGILSY